MSLLLNPIMPAVVFLPLLGFNGLAAEASREMFAECEECFQTPKTVVLSPLVGCFNDVLMQPS